MKLDQKNRAKKIISILKELYPNATCELNYTSAFELLIATILSAQCTDVQVNKVTRELFKKFNKPKDFVNADIKEIEKLIYSTGFYKNKAKNIINCANMIYNEYNSQVPDSLEKLIKLPGVGRKTANVLLFNAFGKNEGIVVDTHVKRIAKRLGLTDSDKPEKIEKELMELFDKKDWGMLSHYFIFHGRRVCSAKKPKCIDCKLQNYCIYKDEK